MTPRAKRTLASFRRQIRERVTVRRGSGGTATNNHVRARVVGFQPDELVGDIDQGDRKVIMIAEDVTLPEGIRKGDRILWNGAPLTVEGVDDATGNVDGVLVVLYLRVRG